MMKLKYNLVLSWKKANSSFGFTLAEVLVTLGIIGIVAALTMPTLISNHQKKVYATQLHKVYNEFSSSVDSFMTSRNAVDIHEAGFGSKHDAPNGGDFQKNFLHTYFKVVKDCDGNLTPCFASQYKGLKGNISQVNSNILGNKVVLSSGAAVALWVTKSGDNGDFYVAEIYVDVNGQKGPNIVGRDLFRMYLYNKGSILDDYEVDANCRETGSCIGSGSSGAVEKRLYNFNEYCAKGDDPDGCFGRLLNDNWEMKY